MPIDVPRSGSSTDRLRADRVSVVLSFRNEAENIPTLVVAASFQKDPQVLLAHPGQGFEKFEDLKKATLFISSEGQQSYFKWMQAEFGFTPEKVKPYTFNAAPFGLIRMAGGNPACRIGRPASCHVATSRSCADSSVPAKSRDTGRRRMGA